MEEIMQEKISADHLLYVSLKYTKTCDVIMNLLKRWKGLIETTVDKILQHAKKKKKISTIPENTIKRIDTARELFKDEEDMVAIFDFYEMSRKLDDLRKERIGEFRKNVCLKIKYKGEEINVDLEKLREYSEKLEKFISNAKQFLTS